MKPDTTIEQLRTILETSQKNITAHLHMQPSFRGTVNTTEKARESAVLIILFERNNKIYTIYTKRTENPLDKHSGQISFPGGSRDIEDTSLQQTAIRETWEEIGIECKESDIVSELSEIHIPLSNFIVFPFVAIIREAPKLYNLQEKEIAEVIEIPLLHLMDSQNKKTKIITHENQKITIPFYEFNSHEIWGATAMISTELIWMLKKTNTPL